MLETAFSLAGKVAVVTGGASGIGAAIVERFRTAGARVVIADRNFIADSDYVAAVTGIPDNLEIPFIEEHTPLGRLVEPEEIAAAAHFLVSDEAAAITGHNLCVDGGIAAGWMRYDLTPPANLREGKWHDEPVLA